MTEPVTSSSEIFSAWLFNIGALDGLGVLGVIGYVSAYFLLQIGLLKGDGYTFSLVNLVASACILASLSRDFNAYSATVELAWSSISIIGLTRIFLVHRLIRLNEQEAMAIRIAAPGLKKDRARKLLRTGRFESAEPGRALAEEGKPVEHFAILLAGHGLILKGGVEVASLGAGSMVGEMTYATGIPATATVIVDKPSRLFMIEARSLREFLARHSDIALAMELSSASDMRLKLTKTTQSLSEQRAGNGAAT